MPEFHISQGRAIGRRLRKNHAYILAVQAVAYCGKLAIHPTPAGTWDTFLERASVGPLPELAVVLAGVAFHGTWITVAAVTLAIEKHRRARGKPVALG